MTPLPTVRILESITPISLGFAYEIRVELIEVDGIRRIRIRGGKRVPEAEDVERQAVAVRRFIASLAASTNSTAKRFTREASEIVAAHLESGENMPTVRSWPLNLAIVPSEIVRCLRESGILARFNISEPETISPTLDVQGVWTPTDEVIEIEGYTSHGWAEVVRAADRSRVMIDEHFQIWHEVARSD